MFISGRRTQRTRLWTLEIIQNIAPDHPSITPAVIDDGAGEFRIDVSSIRQCFLEAFRLRSEHAASIDKTMRILAGSSTLTSAPIEHGLADEVILLVNPVLLGKRKRLFAKGTPPRALMLDSAQALPSGIVINIFKTAGPLRNQQ